LKLILGEGEILGFDMVAIAVAIGAVIGRRVFGIWVKLFGVFSDAAECLGCCRSSVP
jgi:hypothetical protein